MCGIVGYIGNATAFRSSWTRCAGLEYRGYDSAGIAVIDDGRGPGRLRRPRASSARLAERLANGEALHGQVGLGHTRWATHGRPSDENAHPHLDCNDKIAVIHNGIIENYAALRAN